MPANPVARLANSITVKRLRRSGSLEGPTLVALTTVGARSGASRTTPVMAFPAPAGEWLVVASAGGGPRNPGWAHNLEAHPTQVTVERGGERRECTAVRLYGEDRAAALRVVYAMAPRFQGYQKRTEREIPVFRLTPRTAPAAAPGEPG
jgi:deazaflavin-dependent oxidoreductase (nitroreductase family)